MGQTAEYALYPTAYAAIVVGGGHAGCEAALALARCGFSTLLLTQNVDRIGWMSCNPAIGGIGKSHLVAEIDALGGEMARNTDQAGVHYKRLNASRGPAVQALRAQCDKLVYATAIRQTLENTDLLTIKQADVQGLWLEQGQLRGVRSHQGLTFAGQVVVLTAGTFLGAVLHTGMRTQAGGRAGDSPSLGLGDQLRLLGVQTQRHKTGTCPRLDKRSIDFAGLPLDPGLVPPPPMARDGAGAVLPQMPCHMTWTNERTHDLIRENLHRSPMFAGVIAGIGPRYCPSVEDKVVRFADHDRHQLFLEREGWQTQEVYVNGLSTSLPADVQVRMIHSISGLERAEIVRFGYAVEYDAIDPRQLGIDLQLKVLPGLFLAGQVNGTSGYEEAAAQGLAAGLGAVARLRGEPAPVFSRSDSYIGVMIDDLVTRGASEPYRMFTSRAEGRLHLRASNADLRLTPLGRRLGLVGDKAWTAHQQRVDRLAKAKAELETTLVKPTRENLARLEPLGAGTLVAPQSLSTLLCRPELDFQQIAPWVPSWMAAELSPDDQVELITAFRYRGYIAREAIRQARTQRNENLAIPEGLDYASVGGLTTEARTHLTQQRPAHLGHASRLPGVTPAAIAALSFHLTRRLRLRIKPEPGHDAPP